MRLEPRVVMQYGLERRLISRGNGGDGLCEFGIYTGDFPKTIKHAVVMDRKETR